MAIQWLLSALVVSVAWTSVGADDSAWHRHTIDNSARGADGVRLADINGDGRLDLTTGWEEEGIVRVYLQPEAQLVTQPWPSVTVGQVRSPEDAVFVDLDADGRHDVVSCTEGKSRTVFVHWAPRDSRDLLNTNAWRTESIAATQSVQMWMFAIPLDVDGANGPDLIVGSKGENGAVGWLESPENPRNLEAWKYHSLRAAGWIMSLDLFDMDGDGDQDIVASDRKGSRRGVFWLENPGAAQVRNGAAWHEGTVGAIGREVMFVDVSGRDSDNVQIAAAIKPTSIMVLQRSAKKRSIWTSEEFILPARRIGTAKAVRAADVDLNGVLDYVYSCEEAQGARSGVVWVDGHVATGPIDHAAMIHDISGAAGVKFDLLELLDLDRDGDQDVITCEERDQLGIVWYENPTR